MPNKHSHMMSLINKRCLFLLNESVNKSEVSIPITSYRYVKNLMSPSAVNEFVKVVGSSTANATAYCIETLEIAKAMPENEQVKIINRIIDTVIPKLTVEKLELIANEYNIEGLCEASTAKLNTAIKEMQVVDRIMKNDKSLAKRFDFDKRIQSTPYANNSDIIRELCEWIDTYQLSKEAKYNIALENISYSFSKNKRSFSIPEIIEEVTSYFVSAPVITDKEYRGLRKVLENNLIVSEVKNELPKIALDILSEEHQDYKYKILKLEEKCDDKNCAKLLHSVLKIKNEKQASAYINKVVNVVDGLSISNNDRKQLMTSIMMIPLLGNVSKAFVTSELKVADTRSKYKKKIEDEEFIKVMQDAFDDEYDLLETAIIIERFVPLDNDKFSETYAEKEFSLLESENFADSNDIKNILDEFKQDQNKSTGRFKRALYRIYRKSPENIIDDTPNILGTIRAVFILGTFAVPVIGPVLAIVTAFVDHLIQSHINVKESAKLAKALRNEMEKVDKDIDKGKGDKEDLKRYKKCLEKCVDKVEAYYDSLTDDSIAGGEDDDLWGDDIDFDLESSNLFNRANLISYVMEKYESNIIEEAAKFINENKDNFTTDACRELLYLVKEMGLCSEEYFYDRLEKNVTTVMSMNYCSYAESTVKSMDDIQCWHINDLRDLELITQFYAIEAVDQIIHEEFNLNNLKLVVQNFKKTVKDLSMKEKSMWQTIDAHMSGFMKAIEKSMTSNRREAIIKGSIIPSFSKCLKTAMVIGGAVFVNPILGLITALGIYGSSKALNARERQLIFDEIETELKVIDKQIQLADNDGDIKQYRFLLQYQKKLERERQRIKYGMKVHGRNIPSSSAGRRDD